MLCISQKGIALSDENQLEDEWKRVINNPQNVIVSDSLKGLLDPENFEINDRELSTPSINVLLQFSEGVTIDADLLFFERSPVGIRLSFVCDRTEAVKVFMGKKVESVKVYNESDDFNFCVEISEDDELPTLSFEFDEIDRVRSVGNLIIKM